MTLIQSPILKAIMKKSSTILINEATDEQAELHGYILSKTRFFVVWFFICVTFGLAGIILFRKYIWFIKLTHRKCHLASATKVIVVDKYNQEYVEDVNEIQNLNIKDLIDLNENQLNISENDEHTFLTNNSIRYFTNKRWRYIWNGGQFQKLKGLEESFVFEILTKHALGLDVETSQNRLKLYGNNSLNVELTPIFKLLYKEVLTPFYIFQLYSVIIWSIQGYVYYSGCIVVITATSVIYSLYSIRRNEKSLKNMVDNSILVNVFRKTSKHDFEVEEISSEKLVPGDLIEIKNSMNMQCDAILLKGNAIVNESMLTGESLPITKTSLENTNDRLLKFDMNEYKKHILYSGTQVVQTRCHVNEKITAIVLKTGFNTTKGELIRKILYPKPSEFKFNMDIYKYVGCLGILSVFGMIYTLTLKLLRKSPIHEVIIKGLDIFTIVIPPALPGALTACLIYAQNRLKKKLIYCVSPNYINVCGLLKTFVFDKTGTLTEDDCDVKFILPNLKRDDLDYEFGDKIQLVDQLNSNEKYQVILKGLASCHSISKINGKLDGDPLDLKIFKFTKWNFFEMNRIYVSSNTNNKMKLEILKQFPFSSQLQRMSVIVRESKDEMSDFFVKGSPETIEKMCKKDSIPKEYNTLLNNYTRKGYRVISLAHKILDLRTEDDLNNIKREFLEKDLTFLALIITENTLKPETKSVIKCLNMAHIRSIMCTGDNLLTGLSVSKECQMIHQNDKVVIIDIEKQINSEFHQIKLLLTRMDNDYDLLSEKSKTVDDVLNFIEEYNQNSTNKSKYHFAISGKSFDFVCNHQKSHLFEMMIKYGSVYARMTPDQKQKLIEELKLNDQNSLVGMCGDGANDVGALKEANAGISLSNTEASIASPFTSKIQNISCVPTLIKEGRAALVSSIGLVKFICMYSLTQSISIIILLSIDSYLSDMQFLYIDLILITFIAFFFSKNAPFKAVSLKQPMNKLISWRPIGSIVFHTLIMFVFQYFTFNYVRFQPWYSFYNKNISLESTAMFCVSIHQYVTEAIIFSKGLPYRKNLFKNKLFIFFILLAVVMNLVINFNLIKSFYSFLELIEMPFKFCLILLGISVVNFLISYLFETFLFDDDFKIIFKKENINS